MNPTQVPCPHCHAASGQPCYIPGTDLRLSLSPAHPSRLEKAGLEPVYSAVDTYRAMHRPQDDQGRETGD